MFIFSLLQGNMYGLITGLITILHIQFCYDFNQILSTGLNPYAWNNVIVTKSNLINVAIMQHIIGNLTPIYNYVYLSEWFWKQLIPLFQHHTMCPKVPLSLTNSKQIYYSFTFCEERFHCNIVTTIRENKNWLWSNIFLNPLSVQCKFGRL